MTWVFLIEQWVLLGLSTVLLGVEVWALFHALRFRADAYTAAGKSTKTVWALATGGAVVLGLLSVVGNLGLMLTLVAIVIAGVFLADVYPALRRVMSAGRSW